jgi:hypothetical protein
VFINSTPPDFDTNCKEAEKKQNAAQRHEAQRRYTIERYEMLLLEVNMLEVKLGVETRWTAQTPEYMATLTFVSKRKYRQALEKLIKLLVQWLFELQKLNISSTGKCSHIQ